MTEQQCEEEEEKQPYWSKRSRIKLYFEICLAPVLNEFSTTSLAHE